MNELLQRLVELRALEEAANIEFQKWKERLLGIKREIRKLEKLLQPPASWRFFFVLFLPPSPHYLSEKKVCYTFQ